VLPYHSPSGIFTPSVLIPSATTCGRPAILSPVEHHHRQTHVIQPSGHQLTQRGPGPADRHPPAPERHRPVLVTMTLRDSIGIVLALRFHDPGHLTLHQLMHDRQPDTDRQRVQNVPRAPTRSPSAA
jgi:hypothetical protein